jgi:NAD(P)-dependent dehydrogenase (short-subunit alcohol dehydrogenase family)
MTKPTALVTNATGFTGPPAVSALLNGGFEVFAHDTAFRDTGVWNCFKQSRADLYPIADDKPDAVIASLFEKTKTLRTIVSNDHVPAPSYLPDEAPIGLLKLNYDVLVEFPFTLVQAALPHLRRQGHGNIVMITSNRMRLPLSGGAFPDAARAAANAMVRSLAIDCANDGIVVNAVAPNFLYSEAYYPKAVFEETSEGREHVEKSVPIGRLAEPHEIGELIYFLATVKTRFLTGAIVDFSGGWPFGAPRPE